MGTYPKDYEVAEIVNFDHKQRVGEVGRDCFGYVDFAEGVPEDILKAYELITAEMYEASRPKVPPTHVMAKMAYLYKAGELGKLERMYELCERKGYDLEATDAALGMLV